MTHTVRAYSLPLLLAFGVHAAVALALSHGWRPPPVEPRVIKPHIVDAALLVLEQPKPKPAPRSTPPPAPAPEPKPERPVAEVPKPKVDPLAEQRRQREEAERERRREEEARRKRLNALAETAFEEALLQEQRETMDLGQDADEPAALSYIDGIYRAVVSNWSRPPSARNDMEARLRVELIPTGEVISVTVISSSGNSAFDRSAEAAIRKARRFEVPGETRLFERHFRSFVLLFKPQDLLR